MTTAQVVETSVTVTNSSFQNYTHPDDHTTRTTDTPGFKPFTKKGIVSQLDEDFAKVIQQGIDLKANVQMFAEVLGH